MPESYGGTVLMHSRLTKPKVSEVKQWFLIKDSSNSIVRIYYADIDDAFIKAVPLRKGYKVKYFYGENAWSDSRRYAEDIYNKELYK